ncbi:hypothetical protein CEXT_339451 [Caerostris extrusa]|uniref:IRF tryptophan pentad repeat domain-containing protein n=1 Tax=Caerostris extrusa TaxID=172846 RepID=A0AAV4TVG1_CAEEX|nr:hypothetical protein CEXT_339451 [Caerostris extrusa]
MSSSLHSNKHLGQDHKCRRLKRIMRSFIRRTPDPEDISSEKQKEVEKDARRKGLKRFKMRNGGSQTRFG